ncbi:site-specific integrase [Mesorhizobium sp.]|uniref:tyrosine-type recombinase/integrase n=1 Tax=Mesorhizobium sp. TaxID=1871066 RepID=UPI00120B5BE0|nr:site-specific integrase [Mesorhizobium sp.]TIL49088.1 MAG: site-specific integrase [Mesorhizobium sp.]
MQKRKLTKTVVDDLKPLGSAYWVYDTDLKGFCVRVAPSGDKSWQVQYRPHPGGRGTPPKRYTFAATTVLTPDEARARAKDILHGVSKGEDPVRDKIAKRREHTITSLIDTYEAEGGFILRGVRIGQPMKPRNKQWMVNRLRHHVVPLLGSKRVSEVTPGDIERMVKDIAAGKTRKDVKIGPRRRIIVRGGEGQARKVVRDLSSVFTFAIRHPAFDVAENPCVKAAVNKVDGKRTRYLTLEEVGRIGKALEELEAEGVNPKALDIIRLWCLTGCRRDEIAGLKWSEVRLDLGCLVLDDTKTGRSFRPLSAPAAALLATLPRYADADQPDGLSPWVFPASRGAGHFQGTKRIWPMVVKKADLPGVTPHTLRHTLGSHGVSGGQALPMVGAILGHKDARSTAIYAHMQQSPAVKAATRAVGGIAAALAGKTPGKVLPMKRRRVG